MSRSMERSGPTAANNGVWTQVLTCPADHKYEILEVAINFTPGVTAQCAEGLRLAGPTDFVVGRMVAASTPANSWVFKHDGLVVRAGESYEVFPFNAGATIFVLTTYIDVDFTT